MSVELVTGFAGKPHVTADQQAWFNAATFTRGDYVLPIGDQLQAEMLFGHHLWSDRI